jgi:hypothetical protein
MKTASSDTRGMEVQNFINKLGFDNLTNVLFKTSEDCQLFYRKYYKTNVNVIDDLLDFREHKLETIEISLDQYFELCSNKGMKVAFEITFLHPIIEQEVVLIEKAINDGRVTLEYIYNSFKKNINKNIMQYVL